MGYATKPTKYPKDWKEIMFISLGFLGIYVLFYGVVWGWAVVMNDEGPGTPSVWYIYSVYHDLQGKIDAPHALGGLASCLQEAIPERNATIVDLVMCLKAMGMDESYVG
jgi:hypothetical protein